jgi:hypothetical protein
MPASRIVRGAHDVDRPEVHSLSLVANQQCASLYATCMRGQPCMRDAMTCNALPLGFITRSIPSPT